MKKRPDSIQWWVWEEYYEKQKLRYTDTWDPICKELMNLDLIDDHFQDK